jgi:hypothetical protein
LSAIYNNHTSLSPGKLNNSHALMRERLAGTLKL